MKVEKSIEISAAPDKIWSLMANPEEVLKWYLPLQRFDYTGEQKGGVGAPLYFEEKAGGRVMKFDCVITEWVENEKLAFKMVSGNMAKSYEEKWTIDTKPSGSMFTFMEQIDLGYNYRITDIQCALGTSQMNKINDFINRRRDIVKKYNEGFENMEEIIIPYEADYSKSGWHLYIIQLDLEKLNCTRKKIFEALQAENIGVNVHYIPVYLHPYYQKLGYKNGLCPKAEEFYDKIISIPIYPMLNEEEQDEIIKNIGEFYEKE